MYPVVGDDQTQVFSCENSKLEFPRFKPEVALAQNLEILIHRLFVIESVLCVRYNVFQVCSCIVSYLTKKDIMHELLEVTGCSCLFKWNCS